MTKSEEVFGNYNELLKLIGAYSGTRHKSTEFFDSYTTKEWVWPNLSILKVTPKSEYSKLIMEVPEKSTILTTIDNLDKVSDGLRIMPMDKWVNMWIDTTEVSVALDSVSIEAVDPDNISLIEMCGNIISENLFSNKALPIKLWTPVFKAGRLTLFALFQSDGKLTSTMIGFKGSCSYGIYFLSTSRQFQGKGLGQQLVKYGVQSARNVGYETAVLSSTRLGIKLYRKIGFKEIEPAFLYYKF